VPEQGHAGAGWPGVLLAAVALVAVATYLIAVRRRRVGTGWPWWRSACWVGGTVLVLAGTTGPLAEAGHHDFVAHAVGHVLAGMAGPLLLVAGTPVTLALQALPVPVGRRLSHLLARRPVRLVTLPVTAAVLDVGGLWLLYLTPLQALAREHEAVHLLVHVHLVLAGYLLTAALVGTDPMPHRPGPRHRAVVLVAAVAAHDVLAKHLYAHPPVGVGSRAEEGAMVMYYAGDAVELVVMVLLCRRWFAVPRPVRLGTA